MKLDETLWWAVFMAMQIATSIYGNMLMAQADVPGQTTLSNAELQGLYDDVKMVWLCTAGASGGAIAAYFASLDKPILVRLGNLVGSFSGGWFVSPILIRITDSFWPGWIYEWAMVITFVVSLCFIGFVALFTNFWNTYSAELLKSAFSAIFARIQGALDSFFTSKKKDE